jgi:5'-nucleotidase
MQMSRRFFLALLLAAIALAPLAASFDPAQDAAASRGAQQPFPAYRILISNDDGVNAPGLAAVAQALQAIGTPIVVAPSGNYTGAGHSIVTTQPIFRQDLTLPNGLRAIGLTATPASTVNVAIRNIVSDPRPDLVVSGINPGYNFGHSVAMSGTVGAARMAAMLGVPAIAISQDAEAFAREMVFAAEEAIWVARRVKAYGLPPNTYLNVNVPPRPADGYRGYYITTQAMSRGGDEQFVEQKNPQGRIVYWNVWKEGGTAAEGTDMWAVANGWVSVTPMTVGEAPAPDQAVGNLRAIFSN